MKARKIPHNKKKEDERSCEVCEIIEGFFYYTIVIKAKNGYLVSRGGRHKNCISFMRCWFGALFLTFRILMMEDGASFPVKLWSEGNIDDDKG